MLGICGFVSLNDEPGSRATLARMQGALVRCGTPSFSEASDGTGFLGTAGWHATAHVESANACHLHAASGCIVVADSRLEDKSNLIHAMGLPQDRQWSDAELIARLWLRHGQDITTRLNGDFAFAIWDPRQHMMFCARDRMGVKPLYIHYTPNRLFAFASRAEALLQVPQIPTDIDDGRIADALTSHLETVDKTSTFFCAIKRLPPAHWVEVNPSGRKQEKYWRLEPGRVSPLPRTNAQWSEALSAVLERAVHRHLNGAAAVGCMLSGGLDSSSLAVIARNQSMAAGRGLLPTFSSINEMPGCPETEAIRSVLKQPGYAPTVIGSSLIESLRSQLEAAGKDSEEPFDSGMYLLHAQYMMAAGRGIEAVMDGVDGDTVLADSNAIAHQIRSLELLSAWRNAKGEQRMYPALRAWKIMVRAASQVVVPRRLSNAMATLSLPRQANALVRGTLLSQEFATRIAIHERLRTYSRWRATSPHELPTQSMQQIEHPNTTAAFERYHRVAARYGVEPRHPFNDREVVELCVNLPNDQCLHDGWNKIVLRRAMQGRLPDDVCWRTGKEHLGWSLTLELALANENTTVERLTALRPLLAPFVDLAKLDAACRNLRHTASQSQALQALALGQWLERVNKLKCPGTDDVRQILTLRGRS